jgi:hypothetical protein
MAQTRSGAYVSSGGESEALQALASKLSGSIRDTVAALTRHAPLSPAWRAQAPSVERLGRIAHMVRHPWRAASAILVAAESVP